MLKSAIITSAVLFGASTPVLPIIDTAPAAAEQTALNLPEVDAVVAKFSYLEISHDETGFGFSISDTTAMFVDIEFPGNLSVRVGF